MAANPTTELTNSHSLRREPRFARYASFLQKHKLAIGMHVQLTRWYGNARRGTVVDPDQDEDPEEEEPNCIFLNCDDGIAGYLAVDIADVWIPPTTANVVVDGDSIGDRRA